MIKDKKEKQSGGSSSSSSGGSGATSGEGRSSSGGSNSKNNNSNANNSSNSNASNAASSNSNAGNNNNNSSSTSSPSSSKTSSSSSSGSSKSGPNNTNKNNILGIKEEIIEQGPTEQLIVTSIKHEDGSPPTNIIKKEPTNSATTSGNSSGSVNTSTVNSNDSNNNNDTNDNKNNSNLSSSGNLLQDEKDSANDSITDELLNNDELNASGSGGNNSSSSKLGMHIKSEDPNADPLGDGNLNSGNFGNMNPQQQQSGSNRSSMIPQSSPERIQPLPSNIINKQSNSMDYMQQQSQIFVFSTALANKGADAVRSGQFPTIIAYHCAQPETRKFLQKFPLKVNQFNRSGPGWFPPNMPPNMNSNKKSRMMPMNQQNFGNFMKNNPMNPQQAGQQNQGPMNNHQMSGMTHQGPGGNNFQPSCDINNELWGGGGNHPMNMDPSSLDPLLGDPIDSLVNDPLASNLPQGAMSGPNSCMDPTSPNTIPSLQGVKVPDEDLTPQQRQARAIKLAHLQELKQLFKQEHPMNPNDMNQMNEQDSPMPGNGPACSKMGPNAMNPMMQAGGTNAAGGAGMMNMNNPHGPMNPGMNMNGPMRPNFPPGMGPMNMNMGPRGMGNMNRPMGPNMMSPDEMMNSGNGPCLTGAGNMMGPMGGGNMMGGMPPQHMQQGGGPNNMPNMGMGGSCMQMPGNNAGPVMGQKGNMPAGMGGGPNMHMDWNNKMQQPQYYDDNNKRNKGMPPGMDEINAGMAGGRMPPNAMRNMPNMRGPSQQQQGPPPPYHQTPRSASVPIATQSPNPNSPNNPTSNLSLPSPRGNSALNSPAASNDPSRMNPQQQFKHMNPRQSPTTSSQDSPAMTRQINHSNPSTPISSHLSPSASLKDLEMSTNPNNNKEPNLMPVPSPQQISYLNTFEGQELTIQKQPNNNMNKDGNPNLGPNLDNRLPGQKTPTSTSNPLMNNFSIPSSPHTAVGSLGGGDKNRLSSGSQNNLQRSNSMMGNDPTQFSNHPQGGNQQSNESNMQFPDAPNMPFGPNVPQNKMPNFMDQKPGDGVVGPFPSCGGRPENLNLPLNPNSNAAMPSTKPSHFDPISSLAQMSQQLTSTGVPGPMNGQQMMGPFNNNNGMMNEMGGPMGMNEAGQMDFGGNMGMNPNQFPPMGAGPRSMSPKIGPQMGFPPNGPGSANMRMVRPPMGYNGTNIQVKPNAPNTIQYLPARPQMNNSNPPRGPPSLEFLQRYTNPMGMDEMNKGAPNIGGNNMPYFPNQNNPNACMVDPMVDGNGPPPGMMNQNPMMMRGGGGGGGGMRGNMNMRFPGPNNPCMMGNNNPQFNSSNPNMGNPDMMFGPNPGQNQMFVAGPKSSPLPPPNSDMQMMGGGGGGGGGNMPPHFNKQPQQQQQQQPPQQSHFSNASTDPNYAQQYHNFQQQLYATNNSNNQRMGMGNQAPPFMPK